MDKKDNDELLHKIHSDLIKLTSQIESAFIKDEDGSPDFAGHKMFHRKIKDEEEQSNIRKNKIISSTATWIIVGIMTLLGNAMISYYFNVVIKTISAK